jgi:hypothetical protein
LSIHVSLPEYNAALFVSNSERVQAVEQRDSKSSMDRLESFEQETDFDMWMILNNLQEVAAIPGLKIQTWGTHSFGAG